MKALLTPSWRNAGIALGVFLLGVLLVGTLSNWAVLVVLAGLAWLAMLGFTYMKGR